MNARGTRRPHPKRARSKPIRRVGKSKSSKGGICDMVVLAPASVVLVMPLALALVTR